MLWHRLTTSGTTNNKEWYNERQRVVQRVTTSGLTRGNEWQRMTTSDNEWQRVKTNDNKWQRVVILANFHFFFQIREEPTTMYPKETLYILKRILLRDYCYWSKNRNNPLRRNINRKKQVYRDSFLVCDTRNFKHFRRCYDINLVGSSNPDKYLYGFPMNTYKGEGTSRGKEFQLSVVTSLI